MEGKKLKTQYSRVAPAKPASTLVRKAFLDTLYDEAVEKPYEYENFDVAIKDLSSKFKVSLTLLEIMYLKKRSKTENLTFAKLRARLKTEK
jgi:hypothetical protein